jgi:hypothetical protein
LIGLSIRSSRSLKSYTCWITSSVHSASSSEWLLKNGEQGRTRSSLKQPRNPAWIAFTNNHPSTPFRKSDALVGVGLERSCRGPRIPLPRRIWTAFEHESLGGPVARWHRARRAGDAVPNEPRPVNGGRWEGWVITFGRGEGFRPNRPKNLRPSSAQTPPYHGKLSVLQSEQGPRWAKAKRESQRDQDAFYKGPRQEASYECKVCGPTKNDSPRERIGEDAPALGVGERVPGLRPVGWGLLCYVQAPDKISY